MAKANVSRETAGKAMLAAQDTINKAERYFGYIEMFAADIIVTDDESQHERILEAIGLLAREAARDCNATEKKIGAAHAALERLEPLAV